MTKSVVHFYAHTTRNKRVYNGVSMSNEKTIKSKVKLTAEQKARMEFMKSNLAIEKRIVKQLPKGTRIRTIEPYRSVIRMEDVPSEFKKGKLITVAGLLCSFVFLINKGIEGQECYVQVDAISKLYDNPDFAKEMANLGSEAAHLKFKINVNNYESSTNESKDESDSKNSK